MGSQAEPHSVVVTRIIHHYALRHWLPVTALLLAIITGLSLTPQVQLPDVVGSDKIHHIVAYLTLMLPAFFVRSKVRYFLFALFLFWSGLIEVLQPYVNRHGEWVDLAANATGLIIGAMIGAVLARYLDRTP